MLSVYIEFAVAVSKVHPSPAMDITKVDNPLGLLTFLYAISGKPAIQCSFWDRTTSTD
jgi:hypothetical protein